MNTSTVGSPTVSLGPFGLSAFSDEVRGWTWIVQIAWTPSNAGDRGNQAHLALLPAYSVENIDPAGSAQRHVDGFGKELENA